MDYRFFVKNVGSVSASLLDPLVYRVQELKTNADAIERFNVKVKGITAGQDHVVDRYVEAIMAEIMKLGIEELGANQFLPYFTVNWVDAGAILHEHTDLANGNSFDDMWTHKLHVPLVTTPVCRVSHRRHLNEKADWNHLTQGDVWLYNNTCYHSVHNPGPDRAHLILYVRDERMVKHLRRSRLWTLLGDDQRHLT